MKRIFYASGSVVTGDRTAAAVISYARALSSREDSDMIDIPIIKPSGTIGRAQVLLGPASQLMCVDEPPIGLEVDDEHTLDVLAQRIDGLLRPKGQPVDQADLRVDAEVSAEITGEHAYSRVNSSD